MKNFAKLNLKIVLALALVFTFSSVALASEVTGNLSSSGNNNAQNNPPAPEEPEDESISGSVVAPSSGGGSGGGSSAGSSSSSSGASGQNGAVLGEATYNSAANNSAVSYPSTGTLTSGRYEDSAVSGGAMAQLPPIEENAGENVSFGQYQPSLSTVEDSSDKGINMGSWFWIILLSLLLLGVLGYFYSRPADDMMQRI